MAWVGVVGGAFLAGVLISLISLRSGPGALGKRKSVIPGNDPASPSFQVTLDENMNPLSGVHLYLRSFEGEGAKICKGA